MSEKPTITQQVLDLAGTIRDLESNVEILRAQNADLAKAITTTVEDRDVWKRKARAIRLDPAEQENESLKLKVRSLEKDLESKAVVLEDRMTQIEHLRQEVVEWRQKAGNLDRQLCDTVKERDVYEVTLSNRVESYFDYVSKSMYQIAKDHGFHEGDEKFPTIAELVSHRMSEYVANIHGEVSELWEAYRKDEWHKPCDKKINGKPIGLTGAEEELADISIRAMDVSVAMNINLGRAIRIKSEYNKQRPYKHGGKKA